MHQFTVDGNTYAAMEQVQIGKDDYMVRYSIEYPDHTMNSITLLGRAGTHTEAEIIQAFQDFHQKQILEVIKHEK